MSKEPTRIFVLPKTKFETILNNNNISDLNVETYVTYAFICINDTSGEYYHYPLFKEDHLNVLNLSFDDVEHDFEISPTNSNRTKACTIKDAKNIINFLDLNKKIDVLMIHCAGGISRSGAVGQFALDYLNGNKEYFKIDNPQIRPNAHILRLLNNLAFH